MGQKKFFEVLRLENLFLEIFFCFLWPMFIRELMADLEPERLIREWHGAVELVIHDISWTARGAVHVGCRRSGQTHVGAVGPHV